jgi:hypothetical protein
MARPFINREIFWQIDELSSSTVSGLWKHAVDTASDPERARSIQTAYVINGPVSLKDIRSSCENAFEQDHRQEPHLTEYVVKYWLAQAPNLVSLQ